MASSLASQLRQVQGDGNRQDERNKQSLLFTPREAANLGVDLVHQVACNGLLELEQMDERFAPYSKTLFSEASRTIVRDALDTEAEQRVDASIRSLLQLLSQYLLLRPAHKVLEYLIRVYRVNEFNKDALLHAAMPYHATRTFGQLVKLCLGRYAAGFARSQPYWSVLSGARKKGAPVDRPTLVVYCTTPQGAGLLTAVAKHVLEASVAGIQSKSHVGFYVALTTEVLHAVGTPPDGLLQQLLPYVAGGLQRTSHPDYVAASLVVAAQISAVAQLTVSVQQGLIEAVCRAAKLAALPSLRLDAVRAVVAVFQSQEPKKFPSRAFLDLAALPELAEMLLSMSAVADDGKTATSLHAFIQPLVTELAGRCFGGKGGELTPQLNVLLQDVVKSMPVGRYTTSLTAQVLSLCAAQGENADVESARELLGELQSKHNDQVEQGVAEFAQKAAATKLGQDEIEEVISACTAGGRHKLVSGAGTTLLLSLQHPTLAVRLMGIQSLQASMEQADSHSETQHQLIQDCLHTLLMNMDSDTTHRVLSLPSLLDFVEPEQIMAVLEKIVNDGLQTAKEQDTVFLALQSIVAVATGGDTTDGDDALKLRCIRIILTTLMASASGTAEMRTTALECASEMSVVAPMFQKIQNAGVGKEGTPYQSWVFLQGILKCMAGNLVKEVAASSKRKSVAGKSLPQGLLDVTRLAADKKLPAPARGLALLVLTATLNSVGENKDATQQLSKSVTGLIAAYSWSSGKVGSSSSRARSCWDEAPAFPPKTVLAQLLRTTVVDPALPIEALCFSVHSVVARMPRVDLQRIPLDLPTAPLQLPERMLGTELDTFAKLAASDTTIPATPASADPRLSAETPISMKTYRRSPRVTPKKRSMDPELLNLDGDSKESSQDPQDDMLQILASAFVIITSTVDTEHGTPVLQAMLARHFIGREQPRGESTEPILQFLRLFWSTRFHTLSQLHSVQLSVAFLKSAQQSRATMSSMTGRIFVSLQHCRSKEVRLALLSLFDMLHRRGQTGLPAAINSEITKHSPSLLAGNGHMRTLLTSVLSSTPDGSTVSDSDRLKALKTLTETTVDESELTASSGNAELLSILQRALSTWTSQRKASSTLLQSLRKFVSTYTPNRRAPSFERRCVVQMSFAVLSVAIADASENLALIELVLSSSLVLEPDASAVDAGWSRLLWDGALSCVTTALVPGENQHMQARVVGILVDACEFADPLCTSAIHQTLARLPLGSQAVLTSFTKSKKKKKKVVSDVDDMDSLLGGSRPTKSRKKTTQSSAVDSDEPPEFEREMVLLEMLQYKKDLTGDMSVLVPTLFGLLKAEIGRGDGGDEYTKQLVLSALQSIAKRGPTKSGSKQDASYDVPVLVDCMRTSTNPSTRNHTLLLLSEIAVLSPSTVLARVIPVFADVGAAAIQVEDTYSMKVVQQILRTVVPPVVADGAGDAIFDLINMLVDAAPSISKHRRLPLFSCLVSVLTPATYLHGVLLQVFNHQEGQRKVNFERALAGDLCLEYDAATQLTSFWHMVDVLSRGFEDVGHDHNVQNEYSKHLTTKFGAAETNHGGLSTTAMKFVHTHVTDKRFLKKLLQERELDVTRSRQESEFESSCLRLFKGLLVYLRHVMELRRQMHRPGGEGKDDKDRVRQVRQLESTVFACLSAVQQLLSPSGFVEAITTLLAYRDHKVRNRVLQLLKDMLLQPSAVDHSEKILSVLPTLQSLLSRADSGRNTSEAAEDVETPQNKQLVLICIGMMCKTFGAIDASSFGPVIRTVADCALHENIQLVSSALLCLANLGAQFGPLLLPQLSVLVARLCDGLKVKDGSSSQPKQALLVISALTALKVLVHNVARFLGPHVSTIVCQLLQAQILCGTPPTGSRDDTDWELVAPKVHDTLQLIASVTPPRQLYSSLFGTIDYAAEQGSTSLIALFRAVNTAVAAAKRSDITAQRQIAIEFFIEAFEKLQSQDMDDEVEKSAVEAFGVLVLKLSESEFKPVFTEIFEWANGNSSEEKQLQFSDPHGLWRRTVLFYRVVKQLAGQLKAIFVPFYRNLMDGLLKQLTAVSEYQAGEKKKQRRKRKKGNDGESQQLNSAEATEASVRTHAFYLPQRSTRQLVGTCLKRRLCNCSGWLQTTPPMSFTCSSSTTEIRRLPQRAVSSSLSSRSPPSWTRRSGWMTPTTARESQKPSSRVYRSSVSGYSPAISRTQQRHDETNLSSSLSSSAGDLWI